MRGTGWVGKGGKGREGGRSANGQVRFPYPFFCMTRKSALTLSLKRLLQDLLTHSQYSKKSNYVSVTQMSPLLPAHLNMVREFTCISEAMCVCENNTVRSLDSVKRLNSGRVTQGGMITVVT